MLYDIQYSFYMDYEGSDCEINAVVDAESAEEALSMFKKWFFANKYAVGVHHIYNAYEGVWEHDPKADEFDPTGRQPPITYINGEWKIPDWLRNLHNKDDEDDELF